MTSNNTAVIQPIERDSKGHRVRRRTLGLPPSEARDLMQRAYENYAEAQRLHTAAHNAWRRLRRAKAMGQDGTYSLKRADRHKAVKGALTRAANLAAHLEDAKAQYRQARRLARRANVA